ncbi:MAG: hypothetical protein GWP59_06390, partial [Chlamydiales bacterium]|nr:hypothetical protein [Chlamydiales bacterium]
MSSRALDSVDTQRAWDLALPDTSGDFSEPVVTSKRAGIAINALSSSIYRAQGNSLKEAAKYSLFNKHFRSVVAPQFNTLEGISKASRSLSPLVSVLVERIKDVIDGRVFFYIDTNGETAKVQLLEKADTSPSGEESHKARALEAVPILSVELRQSAALRGELV